MANVGFIDSGSVLPTTVTFTTQSKPNYSVLEQYTSNVKIVFSDISSSLVSFLLTCEPVIYRDYAILEYKKNNLYNNTSNIDKTLSNPTDFTTQVIRNYNILEQYTQNTKVTAYSADQMFSGPSVIPVSFTEFYVKRDRIFYLSTVSYQFWS